MVETGVRILSGIFLLVFGRRLFWMFVGILGFLSGTLIASRLLHAQPELVQWGVAFFAGVAGVFLAIFLQRAAIGVSGFLAGGYFAIHLLKHLALQEYAGEWVLILIGGILGAILLSLVFDYALILLSSLTGALLIAEILPFPVYAFFALLVIGVAVQSSMMKKRPALHS